jgi:hypothetical protein
MTEQEMFDKMLSGFDISEYAYSAAGGAAVMAFGVDRTIPQLGSSVHSALGGAGVHLVTRRDSNLGIYGTLMHAAAGFAGGYAYVMVMGR